MHKQIVRFHCSGPGDIDVGTNMLLKYRTSSCYRYSQAIHNAAADPWCEGTEGRFWHVTSFASVSGRNYTISQPPMGLTYVVPPDVTTAEAAIDFGPNADQASFPVGYAPVCPCCTPRGGGVLDLIDCGR
jgi:hypothetical protein